MSHENTCEHYKIIGKGLSNASGTHSFFLAEVVFIANSNGLMRVIKFTTDAEVLRGQGVCEEEKPCL